MDLLSPSRKEEGLGRWSPGLQGTGILKKLPEVMVGLLPLSPWDFTGEYLKREGFMELGSRPALVPLGPSE